MYDFTKLTEGEQDNCVSALDALRNLLHDKLQTNHLGDIERKNTQEYHDEIKLIMKKVGVQF